jgi:hypothetical protein
VLPNAHFKVRSTPSLIRSDAISKSSIVKARPIRTTCRHFGFNPAATSVNVLDAPLGPFGGDQESVADWHDGAEHRLVVLDCAADLAPGDCSAGRGPFVRRRTSPLQQPVSGAAPQAARSSGWGSGKCVPRVVRAQRCTRSWSAPRPQLVRRSATRGTHWPATTNGESPARR